MSPLLLDTDILIWVLGEPQRLTTKTRDRIANPDVPVFVNIVSLWEIVSKRRVGKLDVQVDAVTAQMHPNSKLRWLSPTQRHLYVFDQLPLNDRHRDPFDQLLIAQAIADGMTFVTADQNAGQYPVTAQAP
ncbi:MAG: type II toxin-antitoxin system VapC family toxin [Proteobacteria bacterium]|nr:type II toxin-antitoxin system VapC family toxin [Pseudomonadota bacterium]